jgi:glycosyltransferase EpsE
MPEVSIIMGVHNGERTVRSALESIRAQTFTDWECIICDDGSTDATWETLVDSTATDPRFTLLRNSTNQGLGATLNVCIAAATGEFLGRQDADDTSLDTRLEEQIVYVKQHPEVSVVGTYAALVGDDGKVWGELRHPATPGPGDWIKGQAVVHPSVLMRRQAVLEVGGYDAGAIRLEDYDLWLRMVARGLLIVTLPRTLYRLHWDKRDYSRRKFMYRLGECRLKLKGVRILHPPWVYYPYVVKPLVVGLMPRNLLYAYHVFRFGSK